jgi:hypothetical protein
MKPSEYEVPADKWYDWKGVKRPERVGHLTEEDLEEKLRTNLQGHVCEWRQNGAEIFCDVGEYRHGKRIGSQVRLAGTGDGGEPVLVPVGAILRSDVETD